MKREHDVHITTTRIAYEESSQSFVFPNCSNCLLLLLLLLLLPN